MLPRKCLVKTTGGIWDARSVVENWKKRMTYTRVPCAPFWNHLPDYAPCRRCRARQHWRAKFAEFAFFGQHSEAIVGKDAQLLLAYTRAQPGNIPSEIASLVGRKYTVTVTPSSKLLDGDCNYFLWKKLNFYERWQHQPFCRSVFLRCHRKMPSVLSLELHQLASSRVILMRHPHPVTRA